MALTTRTSNRLEHEMKRVRAGQNVKRINHYAVQLLMYTCSLRSAHCDSTLLNAFRMRMHCIFGSETVASCRQQINCLTTK